MMLKIITGILCLAISAVSQTAAADTAYNVWDTELGKTVAFYVSESDGFSESYIRKAYKKQGLTPSKSDIEHYAYKDLQGLMDAKDKTVLPMMYQKVVPVSSRYALVQLFDGSYRLADLKTKKLKPAPDGAYNHLRRFSDEVDLVFIPTQSYGQDQDIRDYRLLTADATLGMLLKHVDDSGDTWGVQLVGTTIFARTKDPETGVTGSLRADFRASKMTKGPSIKTFQLAEYPFPGKRNAVVRSTLVDIGQSPVNLGRGDNRLYWPIDKDGNIVDRPANIVGMMPFSYIDHFDPAAGWLFVLVDDDGYDFKIVNKSYDGYAEDILKELNDYLLLDEVKIFSADEAEQMFLNENRSVSWRNRVGAGYAIKVKYGQHGGKWFAFSYDGQEYQIWRFNDTDYYPQPSQIGMNTLDGAIIAHFDAEASDYQRILDGIDAASEQNEERRARNTVAISDFLSLYQTTSVGNCDRLQLYARDASYLSATDWTGLFQRTGSVACNYVPFDLASGFSEFMSGADVTTIQDAMTDYTRKVIEKGSVVKHWDCQNNPNGTATCRWIDR